jgi:hypothetical protein
MTAMQMLPRRRRTDHGNRSSSMSIRSREGGEREHNNYGSGSGSARKMQGCKSFDGQHHYSSTYVNASSGEKHSNILKFGDADDTNRNNNFSSPSSSLLFPLLLVQLQTLHERHRPAALILLQVPSSHSINSANVVDPSTTRHRPNHP